MYKLVHAHKLKRAKMVYNTPLPLRVIQNLIYSAIQYPYHIPSASSKPKISVNITGSSPDFSPKISPIATPATGVSRGTPVYIKYYI